MKKLIQLFTLMVIVSLMTACSSNKHSCKGLKAHPKYSKKW